MDTLKDDVTAPRWGHSHASIIFHDAAILTIYSKSIGHKICLCTKTVLVENLNAKHLEKQ
jgi:hypothetical protein